MTQTDSTADILAAAELLNIYDLTVRPVTPGGYTAFNHSTRPAYGEAWYEAVLNLAHDNGWKRPVVKVVSMWACKMPNGEVLSAYHRLGDVYGHPVVPCEVVIRESEGA